MNRPLDISSFTQAEQLRRQLASIVESSDDAIISKDLNGTVTSWNGGAERLFGYTADEMVGKPITRIIPDNRLDEEPQILGRIRRGERVDHFDTMRCRKDGSLVEISLTISPVRDGAGNIVGASKIARDISARRRAEEALARRIEEQNALYEFADGLHRAVDMNEICHAALNAIQRGLRCGRTAILLYDESGVMRFVAWSGLSRAYRDAVEGHSPWMPDVTNPMAICVADFAEADESESVKTAVVREGICGLAFIPLVAGGRLIGEFMVCHGSRHGFGDDELALAMTISRHLAFSIARMRSDEARQRAEDELRRERKLLALVVAELSHRVKNTLATVISISRQSLTEGAKPGEARKLFEARIRGLAQTHTRLAESNWTGASFETILRDELQPYANRDGGNIVLSGPAITINPKSALTLGMAIHELATNASKYGALSSKDGSISVRWETLDSADGTRLHIHWKKSGGPMVRTPTRRGFGRLLLERALVADLNGHVTMLFAEAGLECMIDLPLSDERDRSSWPEGSLK